MLVRIDFASMVEFLRECGRTFGEQGAAAPFPRWWPGFDLWYLTVGYCRGSRRACLEEADVHQPNGPEWMSDLVDEYQRLRAGVWLRDAVSGRTSALVAVRRIEGPDGSSEFDVLETGGAGPVA